MVRCGGPRPVKAVVTLPTRALGTIYQNNTGRPVLVIATVNCASGATTTSLAQAAAAIAPTSPPNVQVASGGLTADPNRTVAENATFCIVFAVPPGFYYRLNSSTTGTGTVTLSFWTEVEL